MSHLCKGGAEAYSRAGCGLRAKGRSGGCPARVVGGRVMAQGQRGNLVLPSSVFQSVRFITLKTLCVRLKILIRKGNVASVHSTLSGLHPYDKKGSAYWVVHTLPL